MERCITASLHLRNLSRSIVYSFNNEYIEYAIKRANRYIGDECSVIGTIYGENNEFNKEDAVYVCLTENDFRKKTIHNKISFTTTIKK